MNIAKLRSTLLNHKKRQRLETIHYEEDKIIATNAYSLFIETQTRKVEKPFTLDLNDMSIYDGVYPDTKKILVSEEKWEKISVEEITIKYIKNNFYYCVRDKYFRQTEVDKAFGVYDKKIWKCDGYLYIAKILQHTVHLYFKKDNQLLLVIDEKVLD